MKVKGGKLLMEVFINWGDEDGRIWGGFNESSRSGQQSLIS